MSDRFNQLYAKSFDPWNYLSSTYEKEKYAETLKTLPKPHYNFVLELGCSIGVFTAKLAECSSYVYAVDNSAIALKRAQKICKNYKNIYFIKNRIPDDLSKTIYQKFDLLVISELLYYLTKSELMRLAHFTEKILSLDAQLLLVNYTLPINENLQGAQAAEYFCNNLSIIPSLNFSHTIKKHNHYQIDFLQRNR